jgi:apolipoprotein N-acyltransferase
MPETLPFSKRQGRILALLSAVLLFAAAPGMWSYPTAVWVALAPLLLACEGLPGPAAARIAFFCGLTYYLSLIYWIVIALNRYGGLPIWLAIPLMTLLAAYLALYTAAFAAILTWLRRWPLVFRAPLIWVALDFIKARLFTGLPWQDLGYSQYQHPLVNQIADLTGHNGLTFLIVMTNALVVGLILAKRGANLKKWRRQSALPLMILAAVAVYNLWSYRHWQEIAAHAPTIDIGIVQGNIDQAQKWRPGMADKTLDIYQRLTKKNAAADLIVWPETALPFFPFHSPLFNRVLRGLRVGGPTLITGAPQYQERTANRKRRIHNSAFALTATGRGLKIRRYDKEHLVPFGEYVPFANILGALPLVQSMGNFSPGVNQSPIECGKARCGILICFESIFPEIAAKWSRMGANLLLNLTNDAWYGRSSAPWQQLSMVTLRAVENRRSLARAANTGISVFIDPLGRLHKVSPLFAEYSAREKMPLLRQKSFFTLYGHFFAALCLIIVLLMGLRQKRERHILSGL